MQARSGIRCILGFRDWDRRGRGGKSEELARRSMKCILAPPLIRRASDGMLDNLFWT